jgi:hypothetical protein
LLIVSEVGFVFDAVFDSSSDMGSGRVVEVFLVPFRAL